MCWEVLALECLCLIVYRETAARGGTADLQFRGCFYIRFHPGVNFKECNGKDFENRAADLDQVRRSGAQIKGFKFERLVVDLFDLVLSHLRGSPQATGYSGWGLERRPRRLLLDGSQAVVLRH